MVPKLRFAGFCDKWISSTLSDAGVQIIDGDRGSNYPSSGDFRPMGFCLFLNAGNVTRDGFRFDDVMFITEEKDSELRKGKLQRRDIVLTTRGTIGNTAIYNNQVSFEHIRINSGMVLVRTKQTLTPDFLYFYFNSRYFSSWLNKVAFGSAQPQITVKIINALSVYFPGKNEQIKIADFLSSVDEKITLLSKQHDLLRQYKKGMMQKIFSQELRFKDENGETFPEWNSCQLKDVATRVTRKNKENNQTILTISGRDGLVDQMTYFNKQIASKNVSGYYLINNGEFAYNKSYSQGYPMGAIKMLTNYDQGVVSTLYICFKLNENQYNNFYQHYFESGLQNRSIEKVAQEGARNHGLLNIGVNDFFDIELQIPSLKEQIKIADFLSALDDKITTKKAELDTLKTWTQGLLQQMFV